MTRDPLQIPVRFSVPDPRPGQAALYIDQRTRQPMLAVGPERRPLSSGPKDHRPMTGRPAGSAESRWAGTAAKTVHLSSFMGGVVYTDITIPAAQVGQLVAVSLGGAIPAEVTGAPFGCVTHRSNVRVGVPLSSTVAPVAVSLVVAVSRL